MRRSAHCLSVLAMSLAPALAGAEVYKSTGPDGHVTYSDTPPAASGQVKRLPEADKDNAGAPLPYVLQQAVQRAPVTLYTTANCPPCEEGRKLLATRGIPFAEKTVTSNEDLLALRQLAGENKLPLLTVGQNRLTGFEASSWQQALAVAGYPPQSRLPAGWRNPQAAPLSPVAAPAPRAKRPAPPPFTPPSPPAEENGIRF